MIFTDKAAKEKIATLEARITELETDITAKDAAFEALTADLTAKDQTIAENVAAIAARDESITNLTAELATANTALQTAAAELAAKDEEITAAKASAGAEATQILASIGQPEPLPDNVETPPSNHLETFNNLKGAEATAYFNKFQNEIAAEQRAMTKTSTPTP
jgi:chromosome segregation ATPase